MKKFVILLLAVAGFCRELNVSDLDGNEIKFELKDSALYENGKRSVNTIRQALLASS